MQIRQRGVALSTVRTNAHAPDGLRLRLFDEHLLRDANDGQHDTAANAGDRVSDEDSLVRGSYNRLAHEMALSACGRCEHAN